MVAPATIVNVASVLAFLAGNEVVGYGTSKAALVQMTRCLAVEWAPIGVTVNAVASGYCLDPTSLALCTMTLANDTSQRSHAFRWVDGGAPARLQLRLRFCALRLRPTSPGPYLPSTAGGAPVKRIASSQSAIRQMTERCRALVASIWDKDSVESLRHAGTVGRGRGEGSPIRSLLCASRRAPVLSTSGIVEGRPILGNVGRS